MKPPGRCPWIPHGSDAQYASEWHCRVYKKQKHKTISYCDRVKGSPADLFSTRPELDALSQPQTPSDHLCPDCSSLASVSEHDAGAANHRLQSTWQTRLSVTELCARQLAANAIAAMTSPSARTWQHRAVRSAPLKLENVKLVPVGQFRAQWICFKCAFSIC